ncbi:lysoplasmalogenase [Nocardioides bizhenqiangii]|uniref:Lysoplasmalogenase n=1 Tax=Nocardioides bizhenqiangii TaxID=3095076 RepID=A0ABZ0ZQ86_9ACTN|nr:MULTISPECIES: lysoplasmalogenase [unclassified Nocardioides]MDZ5619466.1 lysoplasmalogenase [Nocardioides sp. HM23]WQQ26514.1 lysoplasmalogenase [Nocardioides sp. HM61]
MNLATRLKMAYGAVAAIDTALSASTRPMAHRTRFLTKPLLMPLLSASLAATPGSSTARLPVLAAQAGGWFGDVALLSEQRKPFVIGTAGFGVGHLAYVAAFAPRRRDQPRLTEDPRARALAALWAATAPAMAWDARKDGVAKVVAAYSVLLTSMAVAATRLDRAQSPAGRRLVAAGALTFLASDATLGMRKFVLDDPSPLVEGGVMATYTAAQFLISEGAARLA